MSGVCLCVFVCCCSHDATSKYALTSSTASMQLHSCGEEDILIGSFFAISPQSSQLGAQNIALGGKGQGAQQVGSITGSSLVSSERLVSVSLGSDGEDGVLLLHRKCIVFCKANVFLVFDSWECAALLKIMELIQLQAEKSGKCANAETVATFA